MNPDIKTIIQGVLNMPAHYYQTNRGDVEVSCRFCKRFIFLKQAGLPFKMSDIKHAEDCAWKIADKLNRDNQ